jgi:hypothetical protein
MLVGMPSAGAPAEEEQKAVEQMAEGVEKEQEVGAELKTDDAGAGPALAAEEKARRKARIEAEGRQEGDRSQGEEGGG